MRHDSISSKNTEGYVDIVPYTAIKNLDRNGVSKETTHLLKIKYYGRYMDDGYLIHESKDYLRQCLSTIQNKCLTLGITLNPKKTRICKLKEGVSFLKMRFMLTDSGRVIRKLSRESITRMRRKLMTKKMEEKI